MFPSWLLCLPCVQSFLVFRLRIVAFSLVLPLSSTSHERACVTMFGAALCCRTTQSACRFFMIHTPSMRLWLCGVNRGSITKRRSAFEIRVTSSEIDIQVAICTEAVEYQRRLAALLADSNVLRISELLLTWPLCFFLSIGVSYDWSLNDNTGNESILFRGVCVCGIIYRSDGTALKLSR